jgi:hypothetical protein
MVAALPRNGGRLRSESVAAINRKGGRLQSESVAGIPRNSQPGEREGQQSRESIGWVYVYFSLDSKGARRQQQRRLAQAGRSSAALIVTNPDLATEKAKAMILLFYSLLDEKQRRLHVGLESLKLGHGGDAHIASLLEIDPHT